MQPQWLSMKVTSKTHVRSSSGSSKLTHSCMPSFVWTSATRQLPPQLARGQEALPELVHHHPFVGCVKSIAGQADAEKENGGVEHPAQRFLGSAAALACE